MWTTGITLEGNYKIKYFIKMAKSMFRFQPNKKTKHKRHSKSKSTFKELLIVNNIEVRDDENIIAITIISITFFWTIL